MREGAARKFSEESTMRDYFDKQTIEDIDVSGKTVLVRVDFNVPIEAGRVVDDSRIVAALPTIAYLRDQGAKIILVSHLGRPKGEVKPEFALAPVAARLSEMIGAPVLVTSSTVGDEVAEAARGLKPSEIMMLENVRFNPGEAVNDPDFAKQLAGLADIFVNDAFGTAHREHASTVGVANYLPAVAGLLLEKEVSMLERLTESPKRPFMACLGGNKISDKIGVINKFLDLVDGIIAGGGMCFTFLKAKGCDIGASIVEDDQLELAKEMIAKAEENQVTLYLPTDIIAAPEISSEASYKLFPASAIPSGWKGLDIGPETIEIYGQVLESAKTIFWNGPMGVFEIPQFARGTKAVARSISDATGYGSLTIVGGGDSLAALKNFGLEDSVTFASTGGGASLKILEGTPLPGVEALLDR